MIAVIDTDGSITIHPIAYEAWRSFAQALPDTCAPGMVVVGPGIDGTIRITPLNRGPVSLDDIDTGNPEDAGAHDEAHTDATPTPARKPRARKAAPAPECYDGAPLIAHLRATGPQTIAQVCKALHSHPDAIRAALTAIGAVRSGKAKGTRYAAPAIVDALEAGAQDAVG